LLKGAIATYYHYYLLEWETEAKRIKISQLDSREIKEVSSFIVACMHVPFREGIGGDCTQAVRTKVVFNEMFYRSFLSSYYLSFFKGWMGRGSPD